ncbi:MAG: MoaD/ThiS family protein [Bacteroidales bacterium]|nr:MoaD/ThiS family protein [Bacteroidales bacterium]
MLSVKHNLVTKYSILKLSIKLFATIRLDTGHKMVDVNIDKAVNIVEMLKIVSNIIDFDLIDKLIKDNTIIPGVIILLDGVNIHHLNKLDTRITKNTTISIFPAAAGG